MTTDEHEAPADRILAVTFEGGGILGERVHIELSPRATVLVGRNAAGKSLLLESLRESASLARREASPSLVAPRAVTFDLLLAGRTATYAFSWSEQEEDDEPGLAWCERLVADGQERWRVESGSAIFPDERRLPLPLGFGLLHVASSVPVPEEAKQTRRLLAGVRLLRAGVPRTAALREPIYAYGDDTPFGTSWRMKKGERLRATLVQLLRWHADHPELLSSVEEICRRLQLLRALVVEIDAVSRGNKPNLPAHEGQVLVDGVNFGCLSDGTLRVLEIVVNLVDPRTSVLLLEEPETAIHPGLLDRLLGELDAFAHERQLVISTHSPALANWARPDEVRLVTRDDGTTSARALTPDERQSVALYLQDDLGVGDFVFSGGLE